MAEARAEPEPAAPPARTRSDESGPGRRRTGGKAAAHPTAEEAGTAADRASATREPGTGGRKEPDEPADQGDRRSGARSEAGERGEKKEDHGRRPAAAEPETSDWAAPAPPAAPVDLDLVVRSWPLVLEKVRAASRVVATFLDHGRPVALEGRQLVVEFPAQARFYADALGQEGRSRRVDAALDAVLGGNLEIRILLGKAVGKAGQDPSAPEAARPDAAPAEFEVDPDNDAGEVLDADADARAVADWAAEQLGGEVIEERPNEAADSRRRPSRKKGAGGSGGRKR
jgi:hypothetical protein